jgi:hypothetical protein
MATIELHPDFKDLLRLLNSNGVRYLLVGGYAVGYHGHPRATGDMDIWIAVDEDNVEKVARAVQEFGMPADQATKDVFLEVDHVIRMGLPPVRIEIITGASGVEFDECFEQREIVEIDGIPINVISLSMLKANKKACGRLKDLEDLRHLP